MPNALALDTEEAEEEIRRQRNGAPTWIHHVRVHEAESIIRRIYDDEYLRALREAEEDNPRYSGGRANVKGFLDQRIAAIEKDDFDVAVKAEGQAEKADVVLRWISEFREALLASDAREMTRLTGWMETIESLQEEVCRALNGGEPR